MTRTTAAKRAPGLLRPRRTPMNDGRTAVLRPVRAADAPGYIALDTAVTRAGEGVVRSSKQVVRDPVKVRKSIRAWTHGEWSGVNGCRLVAVVGGVVAGTGRIQRHTAQRVRHCAGLGLAVHPKYQGLGLGRAIMQGLIDWCASAGVNRVELNVLARNARAIALYESLGFVIEGRRRRCIRFENGDEEEDLMMGLLIDEQKSPGPRGRRIKAGSRTRRPS